MKVKTLLPKKPVKPHENSFSKNKSAVPAEISSLHIRKKKKSIINHKKSLQETKTHILTKKVKKKKSQKWSRQKSVVMVSVQSPSQ